MYLAEGLQKKWAPVLDHEDMPKIKDPYRRAVTAVLLENQETAMREQATSGNFGVLSEAPTNNTGDVQNNDTVLISMIRSTMPNLIAYDICGVQPMTGPTGLIFAMRAKYDTQDGTDTMYNEPDTRHSGDAGAEGSAGIAPSSVDKRLSSNFLNPIFSSIPPKSSAPDFETPFFEEKEVGSGQFNLSQSRTFVIIFANLIAFENVSLGSPIPPP